MLFYYYLCLIEKPKLLKSEEALNLSLQFEIPFFSLYLKVSVEKVQLSEVSHSKPIKQKMNARFGYFDCNSEHKKKTSVCSCRMLYCFLIKYRNRKMHLMPVQLILISSSGGGLRPSVTLLGTIRMLKIRGFFYTCGTNPIARKRSRPPRGTSAKICSPLIPRCLYVSGWFVSQQ